MDWPNNTAIQRVKHIWNIYRVAQISFTTLWIVLIKHNSGKPLQLHFTPFYNEKRANCKQHFWKVKHITGIRGKFTQERHFFCIYFVLLFMNIACWSIRSDDLWQLFLKYWKEDEMLQLFAYSKSWRSKCIRISTFWQWWLTSNSYIKLPMPGEFWIPWSK